MSSSMGPERRSRVCARFDGRRHASQTCGRGLRLLCFLSFTVSLCQGQGLPTITMVNSCGTSDQDNGKIVESHDDAVSDFVTSSPLDCSLTLQVPSPYTNILFQFRFFEITSSLTTTTTSTPTSNSPVGTTQSAADVCDDAGAHVTFYDGSSSSASVLSGPLCGSTTPGSVIATAGNLTMRLVISASSAQVSFVGDYTSFHTDTGSCTGGNLFQCTNSRCIAYDLTCDQTGIDNCGDASDQSFGPPANCNPTTAPPAVVTEEGLSPAVVGVVGTMGSLTSVAALYWLLWKPGWLTWRLSSLRHVKYLSSIGPHCLTCSQFCQNKLCSPLDACLGTGATLVTVTPVGITIVVAEAEASSSTAASQNAHIVKKEPTKTRLTKRPGSPSVAVAPAPAAAAAAASSPFLSVDYGRSDLVRLTTDRARPREGDYLDQYVWASKKRLGMELL
ncbi:uncharacterized protein [Branchiostoma lanceolatum]|uniref:uncharacterized protein isoform X1 n=2 Tax=Branchiostoma lanceolatum TaxID=7740 RepID=UPI0034522C7A